MVASYDPDTIFLPSSVIASELTASASLCTLSFLISLPLSKSHTVYPDPDSSPDPDTARLPSGVIASELILLCTLSFLISLPLSKSHTLMVVLYPVSNQCA